MSEQRRIIKEKGREEEKDEEFAKKKFGRQKGNEEDK